MRILIDGRAADCIPVGDRGLQYGDGVFETIRITGGRPCLWSQHLARLRLGAERLGLPLPEGSLLYREIRQLTSDRSAAVVKLIVTRGDGERGYAPPRQATARRILIRYAVPSHPNRWVEEGVAVTLCRTPTSESPVLAGIKHLNRLDQVLARAEWDDPGVAEGLMCDVRGVLIGGTSTNLFLLRDGELITPRLDRCGIAGTVRAVIAQLAPGMGLSMTESDIQLQDLFSADGAFLTNAVIGLWSIRRCQDRELKVGALPRALLSAVREATTTPDWGWDCA